jgi:two-component system sensor histidine kinase DesK
MLAAMPRAARPDDLARVRSYTRWSLIVLAAGTVVVPAGDLVGGDETPVVRVVLVLLLLAAGREQLRLLLGAMGEVDARDLLRPPALAAGAAALAVLAVAATDPDASGLGSWSLPFAGLVGASAVRLSGPWRPWLVAGGAALSAIVGAAAAVLGDGVLLTAVVAPVIVVGVIALADVLQLWVWNVTLRLDEARATAGELAVLRERLRFAADLHDVQGHHLQAIALKAELARRLVGVDDDGARRNAAEVQELTLAALADTRALVRGYRRVGLVTELENAVAILRAAGVEASVTGTPEQVPEPLQPLFGALVREAATNLLRHSVAERCTLAVDVRGGEVVLRVQDDGTARTPATADDDPGTGVVALRERFAAVGGRVDAESLPGRGFALTGRAPR